MQRHQPTTEAGHIALIEQVLADVRELRRELRDDRQELWKAINDLRESITGNDKEGLSVRVDRNTNFRKTITRLLWALFTPLYGALIVLLIKLILER